MLGWPLEWLLGIVGSAVTVVLPTFALLSALHCLMQLIGPRLVDTIVVGQLAWQVFTMITWHRWFDMYRGVSHACALVGTSLSESILVIVSGCSIGIVQPLQQLYMIPP